ncbi:hypothetical protein J437_LFUL010817 [Ladona fulva]|uniref:Cilia- and flagella-associated protein 206 n=1 Tax=Ladona fulva TaxID=123851 RepID=A0A8K0K974_LADFU|nr:hypothetical protein J437_LFUL010817 [Ladona fulva]
MANLVNIKDKVEIFRDYCPQKIETRSDTEIQTELHPIESYIDRNYSWNEWDHRRKSLQLAYIRKCQTRSAQTGKSHWHEDVWMYVSLPHKEKHSQTKKEEATNVPRPQRFPYGLRGRSCTDNFHIIDLTRPVDE